MGADHISGNAMKSGSFENRFDSYRILIDEDWYMISKINIQLRQERKLAFASTRSVEIVESKIPQQALVCVPKCVSISEIMS